MVNDSTVPCQDLSTREHAVIPMLLTIFSILQTGFMISGEIIDIVGVGKVMS
jgi:hypothetical protein